MDAFDKHIRQQAQGFSKEPERDLWPGIEAALQPKKRRRLLAWWLLPLLIAGAGLWLYLPQSQLGKPHAPAATTNSYLPRPLPAAPSLHATPSQDSSQVQSATTSSKKTIQLHTNTPRQESKYATAANKLSRIPATTQVPGGTRPATIHPLPGSHNNQATATTTPSAVSDTAAAATPQITKAATIYTQPDTAQGTQMNHAVENTTTTTDANQAVAVDTLVALPAMDVPKAIHKQKDKPASWRLIAGAGMHNLSGGKLLQWAQSDAAFNAGMPIGNSAGSTAPLLQPTRPGGGLVLGLERMQAFKKSRTIGWNAGVLYQYQRIRQQSGMQVPDTGSLQGIERINAPYLYAPGSSLSSTGWQHRLHLSAGIHWQHQRWQLAGKVYSGTVLAHRYLLPLSRQRGWAPSASTAARGYAGIEASMGIRIGQVSATFAAQQNLTPASRYRFLPRQYWRSMELRASIPFYFSKPHQ